MGKLPFEIWPAIDLRGGRCVRLRQGDYDQETVFGDDPSAMARRWVAEGAERLHLVDLDGARDGLGANEEAVAAILAAVDVPCELGGGIRDEETIERWLDAGVSRLVIGTRAVREPAWFREVCERYPERLVLGIDARHGQAATDGWRSVSSLSAVEFAKSLDDAPMAAIVYTDIARDGMMAGPNVEAMAELQRAVTTPVIASGGVTELDDVQRLIDAGLSGCIIGRSLYEGTLQLTAALRLAEQSAMQEDNGNGTCESR